MSVLYISPSWLQVYNIYSANSTVNVSVTETSVWLSWPEPDLTVNYSLLHAPAANPASATTETVLLPDNNDTDVTHNITGLDPGQTYLIQILRDEQSMFLKNITTSKLLLTNCRYVHGIWHEYSKANIFIFFC